MVATGRPVHASRVVRRRTRDRHTYGPTIRHTVAKAKVAVSLDARPVKEVDALVKGRQFPSGSAAIEAALRDQAKARRDADYEAMLAQLDPDEERAWANQRYHGEGFG